MPFNPAHVSGLYAWYRANTGATLGSTPLATGTTPPAVTIAATDATLPTASALRIEITTTGARGTADFRWSVNDGATFEATAVLTAATVALASANVTVTFPVGTYTNDNVYRATCSQWNDRTSGGYNLSQATAAAQPVRAGRDTNLNSRPTMIFDGSNDGMAAATAADWKLLHDGTGVTCGVSFYLATMPTGGALKIIATTGNAGGSLPSHVLGIRDSGGGNYRTDLLIWNASALIVTAIFTNAITAPGKHVIVWSYVEGASPEYTVELDGSSLGTGNSAAAPSSSNPGAALAIGATTVGASADDYAVHEIVIYSRQLTGAERLSVARHMGTECGITVA